MIRHQRAKELRTASCNPTVSRGGVAIYLPKPRKCRLCGCNQHAIPCQQPTRIRAASRQRKTDSRRWCRSEPVRTCKNCCIRNLDGHHCPWWDLCWPG